MIYRPQVDGLDPIPFVAVEKSLEIRRRRDVNRRQSRDFSLRITFNGSFEICEEGLGAVLVTRPLTLVGCRIPVERSADEGVIRVA